MKKRLISALSAALALWLAGGPLTSSAKTRKHEQDRKFVRFLRDQIPREAFDRDHALRLVERLDQDKAWRRIRLGEVLVLPELSTLNADDQETVDRLLHHAGLHLGMADEFLEFHRKHPKDPIFRSLTDLPSQIIDEKNKALLRDEGVYTVVQLVAWRQGVLASLASNSSLDKEALASQGRPAWEASTEALQASFKKSASGLRATRDIQELSSQTRAFLQVNSLDLETDLIGISALQAFHWPAMPVKAFKEIIRFRKRSPWLSQGPCFDLLEPDWNRVMAADR